MKRHLNTLFVTTQGAYLRKDNENVVVSVEREDVLRLPVHAIGGIICFGNVLCSPFLLGHCADNRIAVSFLTEHGRFLARVAGSTQGNVLLRRAQYRLADQEPRSAEIARWVVEAKVANCLSVLNRFTRDHPDRSNQLANAITSLKRILRSLDAAESLEQIRGHEGEAARTYFGVFDHLILSNDAGFSFSARSRRPPLDRTNALLSFLYTILAHDVRSALEAVGLDPAVGYLHRDRPGRPGLALDLMEEHRSWLVDRLTLSLINRGQVRAVDFEVQQSGATLLTEGGRKKVLVAYQERKQKEVIHPFLNEKIHVGTIFFVQALLFARYVRGELDQYPGYFWR